MTYLAICPAEAFNPKVGPKQRWHDNRNLRTNMNKSQNGKGWWHQPCRCVYGLVLYVSFICLQFIDFNFLLHPRISNLFESLLISTFLRQNSCNKKHIECHISFCTWYPIETSRWRNIWAVDSWVHPTSCHLSHQRSSSAFGWIGVPSRGLRERWLLSNKFGIWNSYFVKMWDLFFKACFGFVSTCSTSFSCIFFRMCQKLPSIATRDLSQLPLLPTKVMRCEGWNCSWWNMSRLWKCWKHKDHTDFFRKMHVKAC